MASNRPKTNNSSGSASSGASAEADLYTRAMRNVQKSFFVEREQTETLLDQEQAEAARHPRTAKSSQRPMIEDRYSSLSSCHNEPFQDKTIQYGQLTEDSSEAREQQLESPEKCKK